MYVCVIIYISFGKPIKQKKHHITMLIVGKSHPQMV